MEKVNNEGEILSGLSIPVEFYQKYAALLHGVAGAFGDMAKDIDVEHFDLFVNILYRIGEKARRVMDERMIVNH
jgi:hypothetical protein